MTIMTSKSELDYINLNSSCIIFIETSSIYNNFVISLISIAYNENNKVILKQFLNDSLSNDEKLLNLISKELNKYKQIFVTNHWMSNTFKKRFNENHINVDNLNFTSLQTTVKEIYSGTNIPIQEIAKKSPIIYKKCLNNPNKSIFYEYFKYNRLHTILLIKFLKHQNKNGPCCIA